jgi:hypothetical protein
VNHYDPQSRYRRGAVFMGTSAKAELTMQACKAKYKAEQAAGTLGKNWADFQEKKCGHPPHRPKSKK